MYTKIGIYSGKQSTAYNSGLICTEGSSGTLWTAVTLQLPGTQDNLGTLGIPGC